MDSFDSFTREMTGVPSREDQQEAFKDQRRGPNPKRMPGAPAFI